jgi:aspartate dehydrogenase
MPTSHTIGAIGYGRINRALYEYVEADPDFELAYVYVRTPTDDLPEGIQVTDPAVLAERPVDLVVEGATPQALDTLGEGVLSASDLLVLSGSALVDRDLHDRLEAAARANDAEIYLPHAALLGLDGLVDARSELEAVAIEATKAPSHLDFGYTDDVALEDVAGRTELYDGPTRGLCELFPRNFNSHAAVALAGLGLDETSSTLVADPDADGARHVIRASGDGFDLEIRRDSVIEGVTGEYTLVSLWGSIRRILRADEGLRFV